MLLRKSRLHIALLIMAGWALLGHRQPSEFEQVLHKLEGTPIGERLVQFRGQGIEQTVEAGLVADSIIDFALTFQGVRHRMGGLSAQGLDCSGLVKIVFDRYGVQLPHSANEQARYGSIIASPEHLCPGDLVFFHGTYRSNNPITHSGIYLGDWQFVHTSSSRGVMVTTLPESEYWSSRFLFGTRLIN
jgi:hypothetical protein